jgi:hypothetical protein
VRPPAASQRFGWCRALARQLEQFGDWNFEGLCETIEYVDSWIFLLPLQPADVRAIYLGIVGEPLLR